MDNRTEHVTMAFCNTSEHSHNMHLREIPSDGVDMLARCSHHHDSLCCAWDEGAQRGCLAVTLCSCSCSRKVLGLNFLAFFVYLSSVLLAFDAV
jgi:hypothetical protein